MQRRRLNSVRAELPLGVKGRGLRREPLQPLGLLHCRRPEIAEHFVFAQFLHFNHEMTKFGIVGVASGSLSRSLGNNSTAGALPGPAEEAVIWPTSKGGLILAGPLYVRRHKLAPRAPPFWGTTSATAHARRREPTGTSRPERGHPTGFQRRRTDPRRFA